MTTVAHPLDDLAAYALGALEPQETAEVKAHLETCETCRAEASEYQRLSVTLAEPTASPSLELPAAVWNAISAQLGRRAPDLPATFAPKPAATPRLFASTRGLLIGWAATAAVLVLVTGFALWREARDETPPGGDLAALAWSKEGSVVPLAAANGDRKLTGRLYFSEDKLDGGLAIAGLPTRPPGATYQIWFVRPDQTRESGGLFIADQRGTALVKVSIPGPLEQFAGVGITMEPAGGSTGPTSSDLLSGPLYEK